MSEQFVPPQNIEAEESVIGAMLVSEPALRAVRVVGLEVGHFYLDRHREVYAALQRVAQREGYVDQLMLGNEIPRHREYIAELVAKVPAAGNAKFYAEIVLLNAKLRQEIEGGQMLIESVRIRREGGDDATEKADQLAAEAKALIATDLTIEAEPTTREELADDFFDYLDQEEPAEVFTLPWADLNECVLGGYRRGQTTVLAGWTGMGKSWALDQMLVGFHTQKKSTAIFATEMSRRERVARFITMRTGVASEKLLLKKLTPEDYKRVVKVLPEIPYDYFEVNGWSVDQICERIIFGGYDIVAVDVVNLIPGYEEAKTASSILRRLIEVARRANCHVILVSHLNRARATATKKPRPVARDLRDSGMLEANAHAILFLHRDQDDHGLKLPSGEIYFDKVRNGMEGSVNVSHNQRFFTFQVEAADVKPDSWFQREGRAA